jgi:hypothetical protein
MEKVTRVTLNRRNAVAAGLPAKSLSPEMDLNTLAA